MGGAGMGGGGGYGEDRLYGAGAGGGEFGGDRLYGAAGLSGAGLGGGVSCVAGLGGGMSGGAESSGAISDGPRFGGGGYTTTSYQERSGYQPPGYTEPERTGLEGVQGSVISTRNYSGNGSFSTNEPLGSSGAAKGFSLPKPTPASQHSLGGDGAGRGNGYSISRGYNAPNSDYSTDGTRNWRGGGYGAKW